MASKCSKAQSNMRFRALRLLQDNPKMSQRELAKAVGGVNYVMNALIETGLVKLRSFTTTKDKRRYADTLAPKGIAEKNTKRQEPQHDSCNTTLTSARATRPPSLNSKPTPRMPLRTTAHARDQKPHAAVPTKIQDIVFDV